jgi:hypothetical protein
MIKTTVDIYKSTLEPEGFEKSPSTARDKIYPKSVVEYTFKSMCGRRKVFGHKPYLKFDARNKCWTINKSVEENT